MDGVDRDDQEEEEDDIIFANAGPFPMLAGFEWSVSACPHVLATVVTEETHYLDLFALLTLATRLPIKPSLHCPVVQKEFPPRSPSLWTFPWSSWPSNQTLPNFCTFGFFMFNHQTGKMLLQAAKSLPPTAGKYRLSWFLS